MKFSYTLTKEEYVKGLLPLGSHKTYLVFGIFFIIFTTIPHVIDDYYADLPQWPLKLLIYLLTYTAGYLVFLFLSKWAMQKLLNKGYKKNKIFSNPMSFEFSDKGVEINHAVGSASLQWKAYDKYICSKDFCILYISGSRQIFPLRIFNKTEKETFKQLLSQHINTASEGRVASQ